MAGKYVITGRIRDKDNISVEGYTVEESVAKVKTILQLDNQNVDFIYDCKFFA